MKIKVNFFESSFEIFCLKINIRETKNGINVNSMYLKDIDFEKIKINIKNIIEKVEI